MWSNNALPTNGVNILNPGLPDSALEFHDSTVAETSSDGGTVTIILSPAYVHRSTIIGGASRHTVWLQDAMIVLHNCKLPVDFPKLPLALSDGLIVAGEQIYSNIIPIPLSFSGGQASVGFLFENSMRIRLTGTDIRVEPISEATYLEEFPA